MEKIKPIIRRITNSVASEQWKDILTVAIVIIVGLGSFGLGRLSTEPSNPSPQTVEADQVNTQGANVVSSKQTPVNTTGKNFFASSRGKKYYPLNCAAGKSIKTENRVYFVTASDAEKAGYSLSASCN